MILVAEKAPDIFCGIIPSPNENKNCTKCTHGIFVDTLTIFTPMSTLQVNYSAHLSSQQFPNSHEWHLSDKWNDLQAAGKTTLSQ